MRDTIVILDNDVNAGSVQRIDVKDERGEILVTVRVAVYTDFKGINVDVDYPHPGRLQIATFNNGAMRVLDNEINVHSQQKTVSVELKREV